MKLSLEQGQLTEYVVRQLNFFFPDKHRITTSIVKGLVVATLDRVRFSFKHIRMKYYFDGKNVLFNHLNSDHYCVFLYYLSNTAYRKRIFDVAEKVFYLNKSLHGIDVFYSVKLPDIFMVVHPVGTVLGNAHYENHLVVYQNCSIGSNLENTYPKLGENIIFYARSSIIGNCEIGANVVFAANSFVINQNISKDTVVFGSYPSLVLKKNTKKIIKKYFFKP
ncbi:MAG TPA: serine acetyltransferase [Candidatus Moranbacteria bacterium]|nr:serine acetyltransferase [Candidatus Moranbacteria bacterium]